MKIDRLLGIVTLLLQQETVTAAQLAERFEVSRRTILRDVEDIGRAGLPIVTRQGAGGGISLVEGFKIDKALLTQQELGAVLTGLFTLDSVAQDRRYAAIVEKFSGGGRSQGPIVVDLSSHYKDALAPKISLLEQCIERRLAVRFVYYGPGGQKEALLDPYTIVFKWSSWYVYGVKHGTKEFRFYKLNRLWEPEVTTEGFQPVKAPEATRELDGYFTDELQAVVLFDGDLHYRLVDEYGPDCCIPLPDGRLRFSFPFTNEEYLLEWVLRFGGKAQLLEPARLRPVLRERLAAALSFYQER